MNQVFSRFFKNPEKTRLKPGKNPEKTCWKMWRVRRKLGICDVVTDRGRTTHVPARAEKPGKKPVQFFTDPSSPRPLLAGAEKPYPYPKAPPQAPFPNIPPKPSPPHEPYILPPSSQSFFGLVCQSLQQPDLLLKNMPFFFRPTSQAHSHSNLDAQRTNRGYS